MAGRRDIMSYFPYEVPRDGQEEVLREIEREIDNYDVFVVVAPTAFGKTCLQYTIARWLSNTSIATKTNVLVDQFLEEFPNVPKLHRKSSYICPHFDEHLGDMPRLNCQEATAKFRKRYGCKAKCEYKTDVRMARNKYIGVYNYHTLIAHKLNHRENLILDEAHNILPLLQDLSSRKIWQHQARYPGDMWTHGDVVRWLDGRDGTLTQQLAELRQEITSNSPRFIVRRDMQTWGSDGPRDVLKLLPVDVRNCMPYLWGGKCKKIFMMSATINRKDIEDMGLDRRRVLYIEAPSPIPVANRPIYYEPVAAAGYSNMEQATKEICRYITSNILPRYGDRCKGVIHTTYGQAEIIRTYLGDLGGRALYHSSSDTAKVYKRFTSSRPDEGKILIACGLSEGIDLLGDLGRWQVVAKIPFPSLGDLAIKYKMEQDRDWYTWNTLKPLIQTCGRICRGERDQGDTIVLDSNFKVVYNNGLSANLIPRWWKEAIVWKG